jgi:hypothetical protein
MLCGLTIALSSSKVLELGTFWEGITTTLCVSSCHQIARWFGITLPLGMAKGTCRWSCALLKKELQNEQLKPHGLKIQNAKGVNFLQA